MAILLAVAPFASAFVMVNTQWGRERMRDGAIDAIRTELGLRAELRHVEVALFPSPRVRAQGIILDDPVYGRFAEADGLTIRPSLWALLQGKVDLHEIEVDAPVLNLVLRDGEIRNLPRVRRGGDGDATELPFSHLEIRGATLTLDADHFGSAYLDGVNISLDVQNGRKLDLDLTVHGGRWDHLAGSEVLQAFEVHGRVDPDQGAEVERIVFRTGHLNIHLEDGWIPIPFDESAWRGTGAMWVNLGHLDDLPHGWELPPLAGSVAIEGSFAGSAEGPTGSGRVVVREAEIKQFGTGDVELAFELDPEKITITDGVLQVINDGGQLLLAGTIGLSDGFPADITATAVDLEFSQLMDQLGVTPDTVVSWHFDGGTHVTGTLDPLHLRGPVSFDTRDFLVTQDAYHVVPQRRVLGVTRAALRATMRIRPEGLYFNRLVADTPGSRLRADVLLGFDNALRVSLTSDRLDLADISPLIDIPTGGMARVELEVSGEFSSPEVSGDVHIDNFTFNTFPLGDVSSHFQLEEDSMAVRFPVMTAEKNDSRYRVDDLFLDFRNQAFAVTGHMHATRMTVADYFNVFHWDQDSRFEDYAGLLSGDADLRFTLGYPGDSPRGTMTAALDFDVIEMSIGDFNFTDGELLGEFRWLYPERGMAGAELAIDHFQLRKGDGLVTIDGMMGLDGELHMTAAADRISVRDTEGIGDRLADLGGFYSVFGEITGTTEAPRMDLDVVMTGLSWQTSMLGDARFYVRLTDKLDPWVTAAEAWDPDALPDEPCAAARNGLYRGRWRPDPPHTTPDGPVPRVARPMAFLICGHGLDGQVNVDLAMGKTMAFPVRGAVSLQGLSLDPFLEDIDRDDPLTGTLSGLVNLTGGSIKEDNSLSGQVVVSSLDVGQGNVRLRNDGPLEVMMDRGRFEVAQAEFTGPSSSVRVTGGGSNRRGLALEINGDLDLSFLASLTPRLTHAGGQFGVRVNVTGPIDAPGVYGRASVRDGSFRYAGFRAPLSNLEGEITFSARRVLFEDFTAQMAGGDLALSGAATLLGRGLERYDFDVEAHDVSLHPERGVDLTLGGLAHLGWTAGQRLPRLTGTVRLERVSYEKPIQIAAMVGDAALGAVAGRAERSNVEQYDPAADNVEFDMRIVEANPMRIQNNLIDAEVRIADGERPFRIVGTDQRFGAVGSLSIPRGVIYFRNREFDVRQGTIEFDDPNRVDPNFMVSAVTDVRRSGDLTAPNWRITLDAAGNRNNFQLNTRSDPELSQEDIVLLLTVGMTSAELEQLQAGDVGSTVAVEALAAMTGIDREIQRALPVIDDFSVSSRYSTRTNRTEPQVTVGKRISDRVRLTASTGISESSEVRASVEWRLGENTSVQAVYDNYNTTTASSLGNVGVDLHWRLEFE